jgi:hypothetical protein
MANLLSRCSFVGIGILTKEHGEHAASIPLISIFMELVEGGSA